MNLAHDASSEFIFTVRTGAVPSGTVIANQDYQVLNPLSGVAVGEAYSVTVINPILFIYKETDSLPPRLEPGNDLHSHRAQQRLTGYPSGGH